MSLPLLPWSHLKTLLQCYNAHETRVLIGAGDGMGWRHRPIHLVPRRSCGAQASSQVLLQTLSKQLGERRNVRVTAGGQAVRLLKSFQGPARRRPHFPIYYPRIVPGSFQFTLQTLHEFQGGGRAVLRRSPGLRSVRRRNTAYMCRK
jgi:hypothetical protein